MTVRPLAYLTIDQGMAEPGALSRTQVAPKEHSLAWMTKLVQEGSTKTLPHTKQCNSWCQSSLTLIGSSG
jgi:hypothetical protein